MERVADAAVSSLYPVAVFLSLHVHACAQAHAAVGTIRARAGNRARIWLGKTREKRGPQGGEKSQIPATRTSCIRSKRTCRRADLRRTGRTESSAPMWTLPLLRRLPHEPGDRVHAPVRSAWREGSIPVQCYWRGESVLRARRPDVGHGPDQLHGHQPATWSELRQGPSTFPGPDPGLQQESARTSAVRG